MIGKEILVYTGLIPLCFSAFLALQFGFLRSFFVKAHRFLSLFFILLTALQLFFYLLETNGKEIAKYTLWILPSIGLSFAPLIYMYVKKISLVDTGSSKNSVAKHFLLPVTFLICNLALFLLLFTIPKPSLAWKISYYLFYASVIGGVTVVFIGQNIYYLLKISTLLRAQKERVNQYFSFEEGISLSWMRVISIGYIILLIGLVIAQFIYSPVSTLFFQLVFLCFCLYILLYTNKQINTYWMLTKNYISEEYVPEILIEEKPESSIEIQADNEKVFKIENEKLLKLKNGILHQFETEKIFLNQNLTINDLATILETNSKYISHIINNEFKQSFINLVNSYRVEEAKTLLLAKENDLLTIEAIGNMAGFKSKSSFNIAFKKSTGKTPSEYKASNI